MAKAKVTKLRARSGHAPQNVSAMAGWKDRIQEGMKLRRLSQRKLGVAAGLGATSMRYIISDADTITLATAEGIANALNMPVKELVTGEKVYIELGGDLEARLAVVGISERESDPNERESAEKGVVAVQVRGALKHLHAFRQDDSSMEARGSNEPIPSELIVSHGDIVIWSADVPPRPGVLAVVRERHGNRGSWLSVRKIVIDDNGDYRAIANDADYGRPIVKAADVLGSVLVVQRPMER